MSSGKWKFSLSYQGGGEGDGVEAFRRGGFGVLESESAWQALMEATELGLTVRKNSSVDPRALVRELIAVGVQVEWVNEPAA